VTIIDDYGHHPVEIAAVLKAARQAVRPQGRA
jgi:UDP-N-acetylmuramate--alanine ligase